MRTSLAPGIHGNIVENAKHFEDFRIFEIGHEIHRRAEERPEERAHLAAAIYFRDGRTGLQELKRAAESLAPGVRARAAEPQVWEHPARCAELWWQGRAIGRLSEFHPNLVETGRAALLDLDLTAIRELNAECAAYRPVHRFPTSAFDLSIVADARELAGNLEDRVREFAGELAEGVEYVREFQGAPLPEGKKSVTFRIVAGASDRTLSSSEISEIYDRIVSGLTGLGYEFRA
jgi:phenylalanyl-tRNA synthetase beta chain